MTVNLYTASAFSKGKSGGNKAGVVLQAAGLNEKEKTETAYQAGYSETAFISPSERADFKLEYFTPAGEVPICGHATIGTFVVLNHLKLLNKQDYTIETKSGILRIKTHKDGQILMEQNTPEFFEEIDRQELEKCFDLDGIEKALPVQIVSTGLKDILVPVESPRALERLKPRFNAVSDLSREKGCVGIHAFSLLKGGSLTAICRNFAPLYGIDEEAATGTSSCALACYLYHHGLRQRRYTFEQGYHLNSVSQLNVYVESENGTITGVSVGGCGYVTGERTI